MRWTYSIYNKLLAASLLFLVTAVVLLNNLHERDTSLKVGKAIQSMYNDRLVAEKYIFQYFQNAHSILDLLDEYSTGDAVASLWIGGILSSTKELNIAYLNTRLTEDEARSFDRLKVNFEVIEELVIAGNKTREKESAKDAILLLQGLSEIQLDEAQKQMSLIHQHNSSTAVHFQFKIAVLIVIGLLIQALVFASKSLKINYFKRNSIYN